MKMHKGNMMDRFGHVDCFIVCVDSCIRSDGTLGMLNGMAGELGASHPSLKKAFGDRVAQLAGDRGNFFLYLGGKVGMFQNMVRPQDGVSLYLIAGGVSRLIKIAKENPGKAYALEWPGAKEPDWLLGKMLDDLPDNVEVWQP